MLAEGTDKVGGQLLALIFVTADDAAPDSLAFGSLAHRFGLRLDMLLIVAVGGGGHIGKHLHLGDGSDEEDMRTEVHNLLHIDREEGVGAARDGQSAVADTAAVLEVGELIHLAPALEPEMLEQFEVGGLTEDGGREAARTLDKFGGQVAFIATVFLIQPLSRPPSHVVTTNRPYWMLKRGLLIFLYFLWTQKYKNIASPHVVFVVRDYSPTISLWFCRMVFAVPVLLENSNIDMAYQPS